MSVTTDTSPSAGVRTSGDSLGVLEVGFTFGDEPVRVDDFADGDFDFPDRGLFLGLFGEGVVGVVAVGAVGAVGSGSGVGVGRVVVESFGVGCGSDTWASVVCARDIVFTVVTRGSEVSWAVPCGSRRVRSVGFFDRGHDCSFESCWRV
jgi:hypothetical protein